MSPSAVAQRPGPIRWLILSALAISTVACGGRSRGLAPDGGSLDGSPPSDAALPPDCEHWDVDLAAQNLHDVNRLGLGLSWAVVEGTLGEGVVSGNSELYAFHIDQVHYGAFFLEGFDVYVALDAGEAALIGAGHAAVLGFRGNPYPTFDDTLGAPVWWQPMVVIPSAARPDYGRFVGYHTTRTEHIAVIRITDQTPDGAHFEVLEPILGELPETFSSPWSTSVYPVPFPGPGPAEYLATLASLTYYEATQSYSATFGDLRPSTPENRALVDQALADPVLFWDPGATVGFARDYQTGWTFQRAPSVLATQVLGLADECCTGAGGTYVAHSILEQLQGSSPLATLVTGGHAYYGDEACGDPFLLAVHGLDGVGGFNLGDFGCDPMGVVWVDDPPGFTMPRRVHQLPGTTENRLLVDAWLAAAPALYQLHPADQPVPPPPPQPVAPPPIQPGDPRAPWSVPVTAEQAIIAATHPALITVEEVLERRLFGTPANQPPDYFEVTLATTFSMVRYEHLVLSRVKIAFHCGDPRLLQVGTDWLATLVIDGQPYGYDGEELREPERAFLVPGVLLPNLTYIRSVFTTLGYELSP